MLTRLFVLIWLFVCATAAHSAGSPLPAPKVEYSATRIIESDQLLMKDGSAGGFIRITDDGIAVKMDMLTKEGGKKQRMTMTLADLQIGTQDPSLFEVPSGFNRIPGGFFGGMR